MDKLIDGFIENGILGLIIVGLAWYIFFLHNMYQKTVKDLQERNDKAQEQWQNIAKDGQASARETMGVLNAIKTLVESIRKG